MENKRFTKKMNLDYATLQAMVDYLEKGGKINVAPKTRRPRRGYTVGKESKSLRG